MHIYSYTAVYTMNMPFADRQTTQAHTHTNLHKHTHT